MVLLGMAFQLCSHSRLEVGCSVKNGEIMELVSIEQVANTCTLCVTRV